MLNFSRLPPYFSGLTFESGDTHVYFSSYELAWIAEQLVSQHFLRTEEGMSRYSLPSSENYRQQISNKFERLWPLTVKLSGRSRGLEVEEVSFVSSCVDRFFYQNNGKNVTSIFFGSFNHYNRLLTQWQAALNPSSFLGLNHLSRYALPDRVRSLSTMNDWTNIVITFESRRQAGQAPSGWWLEIGGRMLFMRNAISERQDRYISDHGSVDWIVHNIADYLPKNDGVQPPDCKPMEVLNFIDRMGDDRVAGHVEPLKKAFAVAIHQNASTMVDLTNAASALIIFEQQLFYLRQWFVHVPRPPETLSFNFNDALLAQLDESQSKALQGQAYPPKKNWKNWFQSGLLQPVINFFEPQYQELSCDEKKQSDKLFDHAYGRLLFIYKTQESFVSNAMFARGHTPFLTQLKQLLHSDDIKILMTLYNLQYIAQPLTDGDHDFFLSPVHTFGRKYGVGESYREFADAFEQYQSADSALTDHELAQEMRALLKNEQASIDENLYFMPNLASSWFIGEVARRYSTLLSNLLILDLIQAEVSFYDGQGRSLYSWRSLLIHPDKPEDSRAPFNLQDGYGDDIDLAKLDGMHPMAHGGSADQGKTKFSSKTKMVAAQQKEGHWLVHWLMLKLNGKHDSSGQIWQAQAERSWLTVSAEQEARDLKILYQSKEKPSKSIKKSPDKLAKWRVMHELICPALQERLSNLEFQLEHRVDRCEVSRYDSVCLPR